MAIYKEDKEGNYLGMFNLCNQKRKVEPETKRSEKLTIYWKSVTCKNCLNKREKLK